MKKILLEILCFILPATVIANWKFQDFYSCYFCFMNNICIYNICITHIYKGKTHNICVHQCVASLYMMGNYTLLYTNKSFKSTHNKIDKNTSQYTVNKQTYIHLLYINTKIYQQINVLHYKYIYISTNQLHVYTKRKREGHTNQNKGFF